MQIMATRASSFSEDIDALLERYLQLLDQYTTLRTQLTTAQSAIHQNIARANFSADRGVRYGQDFYDERMQAMRVCFVTLTPDNSGGHSGISTPRFTISTRRDGNVNDSDGSLSEKVESGMTIEGKLGLRTTSGEGSMGTTVSNGESNEPHGGEVRTPDAVADKIKELQLGGKEVESERQAMGRTQQETPEKATQETQINPESGADLKSTKNSIKYPIRMFGFVVPSALRTAQTEAIKTTEKIIPRLANLDAEMKEMEIQIRRARKYRGKAEAEELKAGMVDRDDGRKEVEAAGSWLLNSNNSAENGSTMTDQIFPADY